MYIRSSGGVRPLITIPNGHQERKFLGGSQTVSDRVFATRQRVSEATAALADALACAN